MPDRDREFAQRGMIGRTLAAGVALSGLVIAAGLAREAMRLDAQAWLRAGIIILVSTPYLRVLQLAAMFARQREWRFAALALTVIALMGLGAALGLR
ncbi:MAG: DUF1634 domain-containing protein [Elusimicrobia bacterium]|nr:DUF1634 domain-containing protein [Elusimicrobiota bacterium]